MSREMNGLTRVESACNFGISRLHFTLYLYPACISPYPWYLAISLYLAIMCTRSTVSRCIPPYYPQLYLCVYLTVSSCICCIPLYIIVSHRLENGIWMTKSTRVER